MLAVAIWLSLIRFGLQSQMSPDPTPTPLDPIRMVSFALAYTRSQVRR